MKRRAKDKVSGEKREPMWEYGVKTVGEVEMLVIHFLDLKTRTFGCATLRLPSSACMWRVLSVGCDVWGCVAVWVCAAQDWVAAQRCV